MSLHLFEIQIHGDAAATNRSVAAVEAAARTRGAAVIEAQATADRKRLYLVIDAPDAGIASQTLTASGLIAELTKEVRLVGQDLATVRARRAKANFLVEWNLPAGLTMDAYLKRKAEKTPLYAQVPEVSFERTYVCEDMSKCLCLYDSPDESAVRRARAVVGAQVDHLSRIRTTDGG